MHSVSTLQDGAATLQRRRSVQLVYFNTWADALEEASAYLERTHGIDLRSRIARPGDPGLLAKARLDCDWYAENLRCFASLDHVQLEFVAPLVCGLVGLGDLLKAEAVRERWMIFMGQQPQALGPAASKVCAFLRRNGTKILYYAFDEASRFMPCFREIAPHLDVLIHDEYPLDGATALRPDCLRIHRSWVANFIPYSVPFNPEPEPKIVFLGSPLGLTEHRRRQIEFLQRRFKDRFVASCDHSISIGDRAGLSRFKVGLCPEGRKFTTPAMGQTHTDRPFWCGVLGMVPVSENSKSGNRLDDLARANLIVRYPHGDLAALGEACERALELPVPERRRIYDHFNTHETVGAVVAAQIAAFTSPHLP